MTEALRPRLRYLGNDDVILSLEALKNMYLVVTENLRCARGTGQHQGPVKGPIMLNQLVTLMVHLRKTLAPRYEGNYHVVAIKGNQVELTREGMVLPTKWYHVSHVKPLLQPNEAISRLPAYDTFGCKGKLAIHSDNIPDTRVIKPWATSTSKASCKKGGGVKVDDEGGMKRREAWEVHRVRNKNDKTSDYQGKHENFIKNTHQRRLRGVR